MKVKIQNSFYQEDAFRRNQFIQATEKIGGSDVTGFELSSVSKQVYELNSTNIAGFSVDILQNVDLSKVVFIHVDIYDQSDDPYNNTVYTFTYKEMDGATVVIDRIVSQLSMLNLVNGIENNIVISDISTIAVGSVANLVVIVGLKQ